MIVKMRPSKDEYYLSIADAVAKRATCIRRNYGAVIVKNDVIVGTGYCGAPRGLPNCCDHGICERERIGAKSGERYDLCLSVHAEQNSIISVDSEKLKDSTIYIYGRSAKTLVPINSKPCAMCSRVIRNAQIKYVVYFDGEKIVREAIWM